MKLPHADVPPRISVIVLDTRPMKRDISFITVTTVAPDSTAGGSKHDAHIRGRGLPEVKIRLHQSMNPPQSDGW